MLKAPLTMILVGALGLSVADTALALSFSGPALGGYAPVLELDAAGSTPSAATPVERGAQLRAQAPDTDAPPPLLAPRDTAARDDDGFQGYFDRHYRAHPLTDAEAHRYFHVD